MQVDPLTFSRSPARSRSDLPTGQTIMPQLPLSRWLEVLRCPECGGRLNFNRPEEGGGLICRQCAAPFPVRNAIPALIHRERLSAIEKFCKEYEALRLAEGWASPQPGFYEALPFTDVTGAHSHEWKWRVTSFTQLQRWLRRTFRQWRPAGLRILDAGAGCSWMSRELAKHHNVVALDTDAGDHGLNAIPVDQRRYLALQGELENLPLAAGSFNVIVANASLHHTANVKAFFQQAARVLRLDGWLVVMDSPTYPTDEALRAARDRSRAYYEKIGFPQMAEHYSGIIENINAQQEYFDLVCRRPDLSRKEYALKWLREAMGYPCGARFPIWIGRRRVGPDELAPRGRYRAGAIVLHNHEVLMSVARYQHVEFWHTPGGTMQAGESPQQAAQRRILIECNIDIEIDGLLGEYLFPGHREWCFIAKPLKSSLRAQIEEFFHSKTHRRTTLQWLPIDRLAAFDIRPAALKWDLLSFLKHR